MDPFTSLPAELQVQILTQLQTNSLYQMIRASPAMLHEYTHSRGYIAGVFISQDFDDELMQDAMAVLTFPNLDNAVYPHRVVDRHLKAWASKQFSNPLETHDQEAIEDLDRLRIRLRIFMGDYVAKAIARALFLQYRHLPSPSPTQSGIFDVDRLSDAERRRLFQAFLRYEILCKVYRPTWAHGQYWPWNWKKLWEVRGIRDVPHWEEEALLCVHNYLESLYGAMIVRCNDARAREKRRPFVRFYDGYDTRWNPEYSVCLSKSEAQAASTLAHHGLDLVSSTLKVANSGIGGCRRLGSWFKAFTVEVTNRFVEPIPNTNLGTRTCETPGLYRKLISLSMLDFLMNSELYRQRAWAFFDDDRFMPNRATLELFSGDIWQGDIRNNNLYDHFKGQAETSNDDDYYSEGTKDHGKRVVRVPRRFFARQLEGELVVFWPGSISHSCTYMHSGLSVYAGPLGGF
ncbi:hypothetical protein CEP54_001133 [Fusarium duplospermum]|uniref:F-box domain-containing protein n=1 Tax=Fusarium duplospermum TaxID=1325734 RepID=A0A428R2Q1_9HYPO|nr:hypothetical protein CEP54_001133 [Fusarium duplospermum]